MKTAAELIEEVHRLLDEHMRTGGCLLNGTEHPCFACLYVLAEMHIRGGNK